MRKKFTLLFAALLACMGVMKAGVTDLPTLTEDTENPIWYTIKNTRSGKFITYNGDNKKMTQESAAVAASFFYFTAGEGEAADGFTAIKIHNFATTNLMAGFEKWNDTGATWYLHVDATNGNAPKGFHFTNATNLTGWNAWNDYNQSEIGDYYSNDAGGVFEISAVTDFSVVIDVPAAKATAKATLEDLVLIPVFTTAATEAIAEVEAVEAKGTGLAELNAAVEEVNAIVAACKKESLEGKFFTLHTEGRNQYVKMTTSGTAAAATVTSPDFIWQFVENNGVFNIYNPYIGKYLGAAGSIGSGSIAVTANQAEAGAYNIGVAMEEVKDEEGNKTGEKAKLTFDIKGAYIHLNGSLLPWYGDGGASYWTIAEVTDFAEMVTAYKNSSIATLDSWATLSVVFDATLINAAKTAINAINTTDWATFAAIDAELTEATDAVAAKMFTFQTIATDNHREGVWVSANMTTEKAIGLHGEHNYNSIWSLRHAGGVAFYLYNELNSVYMGAPSANCPLTEAPAVAYTFEIIDAENSVVEMHTNGETLHASNHNDDKLLNHDGNESASRWTIRTIDVAADIQTLLDGLTEDDYAEVPALGQYPTAAYNALVEARTSAKTVEEVEVAIATFKAAKNLPVFTIDGVISYAEGQSIYDNPESTNSKGNTHYFKATDIYDKSMWWALDMTKKTVSVVESVGIYNVGTGAGFWGSPTIKIGDTSDGGAAEGIFLFYTTGNDEPIHAQESGSVITRYGDTGKSTGSAWKFTYIGNTYDLNKLTKEHVAAVVDKENSFRTFYTDFPAAINEATAEKTIDLISNIALNQAIDINKVVTINLNGKTVTRDGEGYAFEVTDGELILKGAGSINGGIHYTINDNDYKQAGKTYSMSADKEGVDISYIRSFGHNNWQVLYVPFAIPVASMSEFDVYSIQAVESNAVVVEKIDAEDAVLAAHTPYLIKASEIGNKAITVKNGILEAPENYSETIAGYTFTGTYAPKAIKAETEYVLTDGEWHRLDNSDQTLGAFRVYLTVANNAAPVLRIITRGEEDTTAIDNAEFYAQPSAVIYDLLGRRVEKMEKGIYIVNGRKVVVK